MADSKPAALLGPAVPTLAVDTERVRPNAKLIGLLALGHLVVDVNQGSLPAILPFLKAAHALSYAQAGMIVLAATIASSIVQPVFGYLSDRTARRWLLPVSVLVTGVGLGLIGVAPGYGTLLLLVIVMGLGVAAYHPEGYRTAASVAGDRRATALSWFSLGGNVGVALGPPVMTALLAGMGLAGSLGMLVPTAAMGALLVAALPVLGRPAAGAAGATRAVRTGIDMPQAMALLMLMVTIRSWAQLGFITFVPFYYIDYLGADPRLVGPLLFVFLGAGALGTVIAGPLADRWGPRPLMRWALLVAAPLGALFLVSRGISAFVALGLFGAALVSSFTVSVVLGQAYLPRHAGMAAGLIVGLAIGAGGLGVALLGVIADHWGLPAVLWTCALMPLAAFGVTLALPAPRHGQ
ncbi:MAG TPA: MFS transporter [Methylomirabilota bacterium]|nr:MFS transporter [Methylomirabilota bacterium]